MTNGAVAATIDGTPQGVAYHEWPESPGSSTARQPARALFAGTVPPPGAIGAERVVHHIGRGRPMIDLAAPRTREDRGRRCSRPLLAQRILVIDGAMGTLIQSYQLDEAGYRGSDERFRDHPRDLRGNNDLLSLTQPEIVRAIHDAYLDAGADIIETNTFTATRIAQADYGLEGVVREMNAAAARIAREAADARERAEPDRPRFVAGAIGPTNRTASISPDVNDPAARNVTFEELAEAYQEAAEGLIEGGADILLIETIFDTLNGKAAIFGVEAAQEAAGVRAAADRRRARSSTRPGGR